MRYMLLIYSDETAEASQEEQAAIYNAYNAFSQQAGASGQMRGGEALQPTSTATTVRVRKDKTQTTDGPFAETKEQLGGFYMFDCPNLDEAVAWAAKIPGAQYGSIEVRPIMEFNT